jgi:hypothetical protein
MENVLIALEVILAPALVVGKGRTVHWTLMNAQYIIRASITLPVKIRKVTIHAFARTAGKARIAQRILMSVIYFILVKIMPRA